MKRLSIVVFSIILSLFILGCNQTAATIDNVSFDTEQLESSYDISDFSIDDYFLTVIFSDGTTTQVSITKSMISSSDLAKLSTLGTQAIEVLYQGYKISVTINLTKTSSEVTVLLMSIYSTGVSEGNIEGMTYEEWLETIKGEDAIPGEDGREVLFQVSEGYIQWQYTGDTEWSNLIDLTTLTGSDGTNGVDGTDGEDGREVFFQVSEGYIQWKYTGDTEWSNLIDLATLTGTDGTNGVDGTDGEDGRETLFQVSEGYIQWKYTGDTEWSNLIDLATLTGTDGTNGVDGTDGEDGREVLFQVSEGYIQWKYTGDTEWSNLIDLATLTGTDGTNGVDGTDGQTAYEMYIENFPDYIGTEEEWLNDLINGNLGNSEIYTVTFDSNGSHLVDSQEVEDNDKAFKPNDPTRKGYTFEGWYTANDVEWIFEGYIVTEDLTLYAKWITKETTINFNSNGGSNVNSITQLCNTIVIEPTIPTWVGYTFEGWFIDNIFSNEFVFATMPANDVTLYAKWVSINDLPNVSVTSMNLVGERVLQQEDNTIITINISNTGNYDIKYIELNNVRYYAFEIGSTNTQVILDYSVPFVEGDYNVYVTQIGFNYNSNVVATFDTNNNSVGIFVFEEPKVIGITSDLIEDYVGANTIINFTITLSKLDYNVESFIFNGLTYTSSNFQVVENEISFEYLTSASYGNVNAKLSEMQFSKNSNVITQHFNEISSFYVGDTSIINYITTAEQLQNIPLDGISILMNDIDLSLIDWIPIGDETTAFRGYLDGNGFTINGLKLEKVQNDNSMPYFGFIGLSRYSYIKDVTFSNVDLDLISLENSIVYSGLLVAKTNDSAFNNINIIGEIDITSNSTGYIGGIVGHAVNTVVSNSKVVVNIAASNSYISYTGGLIGYSESNNIFSTMTFGSLEVSGTHNSIYAGGLTGYAYKDVIRNASSTMTVYGNTDVSTNTSATVYTGGLIGISYQSEIMSSFAMGTVNAYAESIATESGGLIGNSVGGYIIDCYATGNVTSTSDKWFSMAGGLVGDSNTFISRSYATGTVYSITSSIEGSTFSGGLAGRNSGLVKDSYATGTTSSNGSTNQYMGSYVGGLIGKNENGEVYNSYAIGNVFGDSLRYSAYVYAGGLIGYNYLGVVQNVFALGDVSALPSYQSYAGNIFGYNDSGVLKNMYKSSTQEITVNAVVVNPADDSISEIETVTSTQINDRTWYESNLLLDTYIWNLTGVGIDGEYPIHKN